MCVGKSLIGLVEYMTKEDNPTYEWKRYVLLQTATDTLDNPHVCVEKLVIQRTVFQVKEDNPRMYWEKSSAFTLSVSSTG